jgi:hypothetical protein
MNLSSTLYRLPRPLFPHPASELMLIKQVFYQGWGVVQQFIAADAQVPKEAALPRQGDRQVARYLTDRRDYTVIDVIEALGPLSQPELRQTHEQDAILVSRREHAPDIETNAVIAPVARNAPL